MRFLFRAWEMGHGSYSGKGRDAMTDDAVMGCAATTPTVTFVIPARNEQKHIGEVIDSIYRFTPSSCSYEVIVMDNASTDRTAEIARAHGASVLAQGGGTVGSMRNLGVSQASGTVLVFLDGDVLLTPAWGRRFVDVLAFLRDVPNIVTGSSCGVSREASWLERVWFEPLLARPARYINSGHLITTRALFDRLGGFDSALETFEDVDFSRRAVALGASIVDDPELHVTHEGYPRHVSQFFWRERWHGRGMFRSWQTALTSRVASLTIAFIAMHVTLLICLLAGSPTIAGVCVITILLICVISAVAKYGMVPTRILPAAYLYYVYYLARTLAQFDVLRGRLRPRVDLPRRHR